MEPDLPRAEAFGVKHGRFFWVGTNESARNFSRTEFEIVDLEGATVIPGLVDCHVHLEDFARSFAVLDLSRASSSAELVDQVAREAVRLRQGEWLLGRGWDDTKWKDEKPPSFTLLDPVTPSNPVFLSRIDEHTALVNSLAMKRAGIRRDTPDPQGGRIQRDPGTKEPTGVLVEAARSLARRHVPEFSRAKKERLLETALREYAKAGLTAVHDAMTSLELLELLKGLDAAGTLPLRVNCMLTFEAFESRLSQSQTERAAFSSAGRVSAGTVKVFVDGALGSRGALLSEPYSDDPTNVGVAVYTEAELLGMLRKIIRAGCQPAVHAIGDRANELALNAYEQCRDEPGFEAARPRLEHAQLLNAQDVERCGRLGITASIQPVQLTSDMEWLEKRVGPGRIEKAFIWRSLLKAGAMLVSGSDSPIEPHNPFLGIYAAVTRKNLDGEPVSGWTPEESLTVEEALRTYTLNAAYAGFQEKDRGSIEEGKYADFVVIDRDMLSVPAHELAATTVLATFAEGGKVS